MPFRFLDLPPELRLMVYERLPSTTRHCTLLDFMSEATPPPLRTMLVVKSLPVSLLATCKLVNYEATPVLLPKLRQLLHKPIRLLTDTLYFEPVLGINAEDILYRDHNTVNSPRFAYMAAFDKSLGMITIAGLPCTTYTIAAFGAAVAKYTLKRVPSSTIVAITRNEAFGLRAFIKGFTLAPRDLNIWNLAHDPVEFILRRSARDEVEDVFPPGFAGGLWRDLFSQMTSNRALVHHTEYVNDVDEEEWESMCAEG
jgi:hypothetical protein